MERHLTELNPDVANFPQGKLNLCPSAGQEDEPERAESSAQFLSVKVQVSISIDIRYPSSVALRDGRVISACNAITAHGSVLSQTPPWKVSEGGKRS